MIFANPIFQAYKDSDIFGRGIFLSLILLSIISWTILWQKICVQKTFFKQGKLIKEIFQKKRPTPLSIESIPGNNPFSELYQHIKISTLELLNKYHSASENPEMIVLSSADIDTIESVLSIQIPKYRNLLDKNIFIPATVISLAPFLGLLGTVWGILMSFHAMNLGEGGLQGASIMHGLSTALATTVMGLVIAIPSLIAYNYLKSANDSLIAEIELFAYSVLHSIEIKYRG